MTDLSPRKEAEDWWPFYRESDRHDWLCGNDLALRSWQAGIKRFQRSFQLIGIPPAKQNLQGRD